MYNIIYIIIVIQNLRRETPKVPLCTNVRSRSDNHMQTELLSCDNVLFEVQNTSEVKHTRIGLVGIPRHIAGGGESN